MKSVLMAIDRAIYGIEHVMVLVCITIALIIGTLQVILRYGFNIGFHWGEVLLILFTVTSMIFAGSRAVREDRHVKVDVVSMVVSPSRWKRMQLVASLSSLFLCGYFFYCGIRYVLFLNRMGTKSPETGIPDWVIYSLVPVMCAFFCLRYVIYILQPPPAADEDDVHTSISHVGGGL